MKQLGMGQFNSSHYFKFLLQSNVNSKSTEMKYSKHGKVKVSVKKRNLFLLNKFIQQDQNLRNDLKKKCLKLLLLQNFMR